MKKLALLGLAAVALAAAVPAHGQGLTLTGETGVARSPQAVAPEPMSVAVAADFVSSEDTFLPFRAEFGVIEGLEVGFNYWFMDTQNNATQWGLNAKYVIPADLVEGLKMAAGVRFQQQSADGGYDATFTDFYGVATYTVEARIPIIPSLGFTYEVQGEDKDQSGIRLFGSLLAEVMPKVVVGGEFILANSDLDGEDADSSVWFGARFVPRENISIQAGVLNNANVGGNDTSDFVFHVGGQYLFSLAR